MPYYRRKKTGGGWKWKIAFILLFAWASFRLYSVGAFRYGIHIPTIRYSLGKAFGNVPIVGKHIRHFAYKPFYKSKKRTARRGKKRYYRIKKRKYKRKRYRRSRRSYRKRR